MKYEMIFGDEKLFDGAGLFTGIDVVTRNVEHGLYALCRLSNLTNDELKANPVVAMRRIIKTPVQHSDDVAVDLFTAKMKEKLKKSRAKGRSGWESCPIEHLIHGLKEHIDKGDPVDVANFAMMISLRGESIKTPVWTVADQQAGRLPEVGCRVSFCHKLNTNWRAGEIKYIDDQVAVIKTDDIDRPFVYEVDRVEFKPIESPEEKAKRLREEWCESALKIINHKFIDARGPMAIYDALLSGELPMQKKEDE